MSSLLRLFCCCGHRTAPSDENEVDETTHLIPSNLDSTPTVVFTDHQRIQERLGVIVRAKERKMVNVNSQIPFNLHNRVITPNPSLSRSVSLTTGQRDHAAVVPATFDAREPLTVQLRSPPSPLGSGRNTSHSKSRSMSLSRTHPPDEAPPNPILNVRLVNTGQSNPPQRVGRPRHRAYGSPASAEYPAFARSTSPVSVASAETRPVSSAVSAPKIKPLDEICLSWGDSDT
ncbi:hypothetical protein B0H17DRAFT_1075561 [Mycena rosella]|uniref:Uncharacterized protein n=1 Tax=Mycena rosella TaxID=1033263 RepID=A0AAD7D736_MYCRO|nr:hypothetical protein B0H17DRAFT_1075561 [Mycena rosella]